mgnify:CR=1 FL=1|tara:strand:+ start:587 stop:901 length:315 start_codon:yes stop_codon:yes gene_type:complete
MGCKSLGGIKTIKLMNQIQNQFNNQKDKKMFKNYIKPSQVTDFARPNKKRTIHKNLPYQNYWGEPIKENKLIIINRLVKKHIKFIELFLLSTMVFLILFKIFVL